MEDQKQLIPPTEPVRLGRMLRKGSRRFLAFLVCSAVLVAAFAVSGVWMSKNGGSLPDSWGSFWNGKGNVPDPSDPDPSKPLGDTVTSSEEETSDGTTAEPTPTLPIPAGAIPVLSMDLSCSAYGKNYISNETVYRPDIQTLRNQGGGASKTFRAEDGPVVLILHTHATEAYLPEGTSYLEGVVGDYAYSNDPSQTVVAVGEALCRTLNQNGIPAIHCKEIHGENGTLRNSYSNAEACILKYLKQYSSIQYVIDLHRDGILTSDGSYVRTLAPDTDQPTAQVMAVVGTDGNGTAHPTWQQNLSLALRLRDRLNRENSALCRPVSLRNASYNQELAPASMLLEIGSGGNTVAEAIRAAERVGVELAALIANG